MISAHAADLVFSNVSPAQGTVLAGIEDEQQITFNTNMDDQIGYMTMSLTDDAKNVLGTTSIVYDPNYKDPKDGHVMTESPVTHKDPHFTWTSPSSWSFEKGHTYYLQFTAYASKQDALAGNVLAKGSISYVGSAEPFVVSPVKLVSVTPDPETYVFNDIDKFFIVLKFDGKVNLNNKTAFVNSGMGSSESLKSLEAGEDAEMREMQINGKDTTICFSSEWKLAGNPMLAWVPGANLIYSAYGMDEDGHRVCDGLYSTGATSTGFYSISVMNDITRYDFNINPNANSDFNSLFSFVVSCSQIEEGISKTGMLENAILYKKDGEALDSVAYLKWTADGKVKSQNSSFPKEMTVFLNKAITEAGTYVLRFPRNYFTFNEGFMACRSKATDVEFVIEETAEAQKSIVTPDLTGELNSVQKLNIQYPNADLGVDYYHSTAYVFDENNDLVVTGDVAEHWSDDWSVMTTDNADITLSKPVTKPGKYTLVLRDKTFNLAGASSGEDGSRGGGSEGSEYVYSLPVIQEFTIVAGSTAAVKVVSDPVDQSEVEKIESITLTFEGATNVECTNGMAMITATNKKNNSLMMVETSANKAVVYPSPDMWDYATLTEADTYTFNFPEGYFVVNGENWPAFTLTFTVKSPSTGINTVETVGKSAKQVYTLTGIKANGKPQKGVYIVNGKKVVLK